MANPYLGQISVFAFPFVPRQWAGCFGGNAPINQYGALYSLIGTTFGGNGSTQFGLPDLGGLSVCGTGTGPGLSARNLGQSFGSATVTLDQTTMPAHVHDGQAGPFSRTAPPSGVPTALSSLTTAKGGDIYSDGGPDVVMSGSAVSPSGNGGAHNNMQPYLGMNYCIALFGEYPYFG